ncbi:MAG TPA: hypothetical protein VG722_08920 [Tepidisphaeraceae bacterium]|nr:hypothetical protein [Tepidisphaeraceae bacterium]
MLLLLILGVYSLFAAASLRWTHWDLSLPQASDASPGAPIAQTREINLVTGHIRWLQTVWLTTPHVPANAPGYLHPGNGLTFTPRDKQILPIDKHDISRHFAGFGYGTFTIFREGGAINSGLDGLWQANVTELYVPIWALIFIAAIPLIRSILIWRSTRKPGHCPTCGYDLRATPDRCPECGSPVHRRLNDDNAPTKSSGSGDSA